MAPRTNSLLLTAQPEPASLRIIKHHSGEISMKYVVLANEDGCAYLPSAASRDVGSCAVGIVGAPSLSFLSV